MTNDNKKTGLSRRTFLKSSVASVALAAAVSPGSALKALALEEVKAADLNEETVFAGACRGNCTGGCFLNVHMRDGKVVRTSARDLPDTRYNRICVKGLTHMHRIYHPERLKYPLKRTGARGEGKWERISCDEAMGKGDLFSLNKHEYIKEWLNTDAARGLGLTLENLLDKKALRMVPEDYIFAKDGAFPTATGRAQFYIENPTPNFRMNQAIDYAKERLPHWEPPNEGWHDHPQAQTYPFVLLNVHPKWRTHTQWWDVEVLKEIDPEPTLHINPADAARYGIREGMKVRAYNDRGFVVARANLNNGVQPGCLTVPKGWEKQQWLDGHYQDLTSNVCNPMVANSAFFDVLVQIEKA